MGIVSDVFDCDWTPVLARRGVDIAAAATADPLQEIISVTPRIDEKVIHASLTVNTDSVELEKRFFH